MKDILSISKGIREVPECIEQKPRAYDWYLAQGRYVNRGFEQSEAAFSIWPILAAFGEGKHATEDQLLPLVLQQNVLSDDDRFWFRNCMEQLRIRGLIVRGYTFKTLADNSRIKIRAYQIANYAWVKSHQPDEFTSPRSIEQQMNSAIHSYRATGCLSAPSKINRTVKSSEIHNSLTS